MFLSTLSSHCHGGGITSSSAEEESEEESEGDGVASVGSLSRARHCDGSAVVRSRFHLFSTVIHAVGSIVATVAILQLTN